MGWVHYNRQTTRRKLLAGESVPWIENSKRGPYIRAIVLSCLPWVSNKELLALNAEARRITEETGILHELDHVVPVNNPRVCGLSVPWNLEILTHQQNNAKSNYWNPDQLSLFDNPAQPDTIQPYEF
jgi:5-methylcytosine-specific restriction endonuclease McrA